MTNNAINLEDRILPPDASKLINSILTASRNTTQNLSNKGELSLVDNCRQSDSNISSIAKVKEKRFLHKLTDHGSYTAIAASFLVVGIIGMSLFENSSKQDTHNSSNLALSAIDELEVELLLEEENLLVSFYGS